MRYALTFGLVALLSMPLVTAVQNQFEVASIKPSNADASSSGIDSGKGRIHGYNVTLKRCIMGAYGVGPNQIIGGPDWLDSERFEITAKAEEPVGVSVLNTMLQALLADRFKLALHREMKQIDAYIIELRNEAPKLEKGDGKGATTQNGRGNLGAINALALMSASWADLLGRLRTCSILKERRRISPPPPRPNCSPCCGSY